MTRTPRPPRRLARTALLAGLLTLAAGCGQSGPKLVPVEGKVFVGAAPAQTGPTVTGYVVYHADPARGNKNMEDIKASIEADGSYKIFTRDKPGAPVGWYRVTVELAETNPNDPYYFKPKIQAKYLEKDKSGLEVEVVENPEPGRYDLKVEPK